MSRPFADTMVVRGNAVNVDCETLSNETKRDMCITKEQGRNS